jgi:hypothetical protein
MLRIYGENGEWSTPWISVWIWRKFSKMLAVDCFVYISDWKRQKRVRNRLLKSRACVPLMSDWLINPTQCKHHWITYTRQHTMLTSQSLSWRIDFHIQRTYLSGEKGTKILTSNKNFNMLSIRMIAQKLFLKWPQKIDNENYNKTERLS